MTDITEVTVDSLPAELPASLAVVDVREDDEWQAGHINGATHIPLSAVPQRIEELPVADQVLVVCRVGGRSARATAYLVEHGVPAINLDGGMRAWAAAGRAMISESEAPPQVI